MKIAIIHTRFLLRGGLETRLVNYLNYFADRGDEVFLVVYKITKKIALPENIKITKFNLSLIPKKFRRSYFNWKVGRFMKKRNFDLSLSLGRTSFQDAVLAPSNHLGYLKALGKTNLSSDDKQQIYYDNKSYLESKIIFACSKLVKDELINLYNVSADKIIILYPPLDTGKFNRNNIGEKNFFKEKHGLSTYKKSFVFVSSGHKRKGLGLLFDIFKELVDFPYELIIAGTPAVKTESANIKYVGFLKDTDELYIAADYTIHPALYEPFGQIISESLACGTPVIISGMVGAKEIISDKEGIVINSFDPKIWIKELKSIESTKLYVSPGFIKEKKLSLEDHMSDMLDSWKNYSSQTK